MGQHKYNPTSLAAKAGEITPKQPKMSKREMECRLMMALAYKTGATQLMTAINTMR